MSQTLAQISSINIPVEWRKVFEGTSAKVTTLPGHLLQGSKFLVPYQKYAQPADSAGHNEAETRVATGFPLLPWQNLKDPTDEETVFETELGILGPFITGHDVGGSPISPASVFHEPALEGADAVLKLPPTHVLLTENMGFASPLIYRSCREKSTIAVRIILEQSRCNFSMATNHSE